MTERRADERRKYHCSSPDCRDEIFEKISAGKKYLSDKIIKKLSTGVAMWGIGIATAAIITLLSTINLINASANDKQDAWITRNLKKTIENEKDIVSIKAELTNIFDNQKEITSLLVSIENNQVKKEDLLEIFRKQSGKNPIAGVRDDINNQ